MNETVKSLVDDLERGYDADPAEAKRELERMDDLCREAADLIRKQSEQIDYMDRDPFNVLNRINVNDHVEKKNNLSYLSWEAIPFLNAVCILLLGFVSVATVFDHSLIEEVADDLPILAHKHTT